MESDVRACELFVHVHRHIVETGLLLPHAKSLSVRYTMACGLNVEMIVAYINEITSLYRARLVLGWVTVCK